MLDLICAIPESVGWFINGFLGCVAVQLWYKVIKCIIEMIKERREDAEEEEMIYES